MTYSKERRAEVLSAYDSGLGTRAVVLAAQERDWKTSDATVCRDLKELRLKPT